MNVLSFMFSISFTRLKRMNNENASENTPFVNLLLMSPFSELQTNAPQKEIQSSSF